MSMWSIHLQYRRLQSAEPEDASFVLRKWADFDFLIVCLTRLRRAARLAAALPELRSLLAVAVAAFDAAVPDLKRMRDVAEHIDDYAADRGKNSAVLRQALEVSSLSDDGPTLRWLGVRLNATEALMASQALFEVIKNASRAFHEGA